MSTSSTRLAMLSAKDVARLMAVVVFPTPPFWVRDRHAPWPTWHR